MSAILTPDQPEGVCVLGTQTPFFVDSRPYTAACDVATNDVSDPGVPGSSTVSQVSVTVDVITAATLAGLAPGGMDATSTTVCSLAPAGNAWATISGTFTPPPGDVYAHLRLTVTAAAMTAVAVNLDNVALRATLT